MSLPTPNGLGPGETPAQASWETIPGWFDFAEFYRAIVADAPASARFVEVGAWLGRSTAYLAGEIARSRKGIELYVVDTWADAHGCAEMGVAAPAAGESVFELFRQNLARCGLLGQLHPCVCDSMIAAFMFPAQSLDFCFIDADHAYESVQRDIAAWRPKIKPGGILAGHDYDHERYPSVVRAVREAFPTFQTTGYCWLVRM